MNRFRLLSEGVWASSQIDVATVAEADTLGVTMIVNNRPDFEDDGQPEGNDIARAAYAAGMEYRAIPIGHMGFGEADIQEMRRALDETTGSLLAYCRSGTRSTLLWALAEASRGGDPVEIAAAALDAGYDVSAIRSTMEELAARAKG